MNALALPQIRRGVSLGKIASLALPVAIGALADYAGYAAAYGIPLLCYIFLWIFARTARAASPPSAAQRSIEHSQP